MKEIAGDFFVDVQESKLKASEEADKAKKKHNSIDASREAVGTTGRW